MNYHILVATYHDHILTLSFNPEARSVSSIASLTVGTSPSWITRNPNDPSVYFACLEQGEGVLVALKYNENGIGQVIAKVPSHGEDPCHLLVVNGELLAANYSAEGLVSAPVSSDPPYLSSSELICDFTGSGPYTGRQLLSHPHQIFAFPGRDEVLIPDLGADKTWRLVKNDQGYWDVPGFIWYPPGSGPRHVALYGDVLYTLAELSNCVIAHRLPPLPSAPIYLASAPTTMEAPPEAPNHMFAAEILIPTPNARFHEPYLYVSNRGDSLRGGDSIAIFSIADDKLQLVNEVRTGLTHIRGIAFGGPDSEWLIAGGVYSKGGIKIYERVDGGKGLKEVASDPTIQASAGFVWM